MIKSLNALGVTHVCVGNHEFDLSIGGDAVICACVMVISCRFSLSFASRLLKSIRSESSAPFGCRSCKFCVG